MPGALFSGRKKFYEKFNRYLSGQETTAGHPKRQIIEEREGGINGDGYH